MQKEMMDLIKKSVKRVIKLVFKATEKLTNSNDVLPQATNVVV